ncbi:hypothetical protein [Piscinibacter defluvii]|uniref:hypothetical protein n=1 Tax=Piscinibacter defluvii TaxID=1796922 RepID=UPI0013E369B9|nr:hypothetical protein [Piscinibacter defluvii]
MNMTTKSSTKAIPMTQQAAGRIQSHTAKASGGNVATGSFAARAQRAVATSRATGKVSK